MRLSSRIAKESKRKKGPEKIVRAPTANSAGELFAEVSEPRARHYSKVHHKRGAQDDYYRETR